LLKIFSKVTIIYNPGPGRFIFNKVRDYLFLVGSASGPLPYTQVPEAFSKIPCGTLIFLL
jgi:hypothetical protein